MKEIAILFFLTTLLSGSFGQVREKSTHKNDRIPYDEQEFLEDITSKITLKEIQEFDSLNNYIPFNDSTDYRGIAVVLIWQHNYDLAIKKINQELKVNPKNADALHLKGNALNESGNPAEALEYFNAAINLNDSNEVFFYNRGLAYYRLNQFNNAIQDYSRTIELNDKYQGVYINRALAYEGIRQFEKAIEDYSTDIKLFGESSRSYNNRGRCYMVLNYNQFALNDYDKALQIEPNKLNTIYNIGVLYLRQEQFDKGCEFIKKAKDLGYNDGGLYEDYCK